MELRRLQFSGYLKFRLWCCVCTNPEPTRGCHRDPPHPRMAEILAMVHIGCNN
jgi:hypothetical protein